MENAELVTDFRITTSTQLTSVSMRRWKQPSKGPFRTGHRVQRRRSPGVIQRGGSYIQYSFTNALPGLMSQVP